MTAENNKNIPYPAGTEIPFDGAVNFRELGGYRTQDGRMVRYGCFYRGGNLDALTGEADRKKLGELKLKMVLDLRSNGESEMHPDPVLDGVKQVRKSAIFFPDGSEVDFSPKGIGKLEAIMKEMEKKFGKEMAFAQLYKIMPFGNPAFQELFRALEEDDIPILFHCSAGKDRTGIAALLILLALGVDRETALDDYMLTNVCRKELIDKALEKQADEIAKDPAMKDFIISMEGVSRRIAEAAIDAIEERYGNYERYFEAEFGLNPMRLMALREKYLV